MAKQVQFCLFLVGKMGTKDMSTGNDGDGDLGLRSREDPKNIKKSSKEITNQRLPGESNNANMRWLSWIWHRAYCIVWVNHHNRRQQKWSLKCMYTPRNWTAGKCHSKRSLKRKIIWCCSAFCKDEIIFLGTLFLLGFFLPTIKSKQIWKMVVLVSVRSEPFMVLWEDTQPFGLPLMGPLRRIRFDPSQRQLCSWSCGKMVER